eukprot:TRINITY_DN11314_c1_g1_i1.p1 TRINITY_DN11314_c1_g1~~TRINITY_DN11314_c1_g1_i1.p1  ORF type:complete len:964 (+),score=231.71 TRINITY_DN11314_c1_g1_i1:262-2892(+)
MIMRPDGSMNVAYSTSPTDRNVSVVTPITGMPSSEVFRSVNVQDSKLVAILFGGMMPMQEGRGLVFDVLGLTGGFTMGVIVPDVSKTAPPGTVGIGLVYLSLHTVTRVLIINAMKLKAQFPGSQPRLFTVIASSWIADKMKASGAPEAQWRVFDDTGILTGASAGRLTGTTTDPTKPFRAIRASESDDVIIRDLALAYNDSFDSHPGFQGIRFDINGTETTYFTSVVRYNQAPGVDWFIVVAIDQRSVTGEVQDSILMSSLHSQAESERIEEDIAESKKVTFIVIGCIALVLMVTGVAVAKVLMTPIVKIQNAMWKVASLDLDDLAIGPQSVFHEARLMQQHFLKMVQCLQEYRAFVPQSLLADNGGTVAVRVVDPPTGRLAIMFTDIQGSTMLWKVGNEEMDEALELHNDLIRAACAAHKGYEVKTIGDAFMVAFSSPVSAVACALRIQQDLAAATWPQGLPLPKAGLVVRIGVHYGEAITEENPLTRRTDYRGSTVNIASRVEGMAKGGTVCVTEAVADVAQDAAKKLGSPVTVPLGPKELRGQGLCNLFLMAPASMAHRMTDETTDCAQVRASKLDGETASVGSKASSGGTEKTDTSVLRLQQRMGLQLARSVGCVVVCRVNTAKLPDSGRQDSMNMAVKGAFDAAHATDGVLGSLFGNMIVVSWNAAKKCNMSSLAALTFVSCMHQRTHQYMNAGIAFGGLLHGNVGTSKSRFATVVGFPLSAAVATASLSRRMNRFAVFADCSGNSHGLRDSIRDYSGCLRLLDVWLEKNERMRVLVFAVMTDQLSSALACTGGGTGDENTVTDAVTDFFTPDTEKSSKAFSQLQSMSAANPGDKLLETAVQMYTNCVTPCTYRIEVDFDQPPCEWTSSVK